MRGRGGGQGPRYIKHAMQIDGRQKEGAKRIRSRILFCHSTAENREGNMFHRKGRGHKGKIYDRHQPVLQHAVYKRARRAQMAQMMARLNSRVRATPGQRQ